MQIENKEKKIDILKKEIASRYTITELTPLFKKHIGLAIKMAIIYEGTKEGLIDTFNLAMFNLVIDNAQPNKKQFNRNDNQMILEVKQEFYGITNK